MPSIERASFVLGCYEPHVVHAIKRYARPGTVAYDCGAHIGYMTLVLARSVGAGGQVVAFEANPRNAETLRINVAENGINNVTIVPAAVTSMSGEVVFAQFGYSLIGRLAYGDLPGDATLITVPSITLDDYVYRDRHPAPDFMKIDVEGAELDVLRGAKRVLQTARPVIVAEVREGNTAAQIKDMMAEFGYGWEHLAPGAEDRIGVMSDVILIPMARPYTGRSGKARERTPARWRGPLTSDPAALPAWPCASSAALPRCSGTRSWS
jgi:FkbM family methyltransferase